MDVEHGPVTHYARMVWKAIVSADEARQRGTSLADLRQHWESASRGFQPLVSEYLAARGPDGVVPKATARRLWSRVQGPIGAAALSMARLGWTFQSPFILQDERGAHIYLTRMSPALIGTSCGTPRGG